MLKKINKIKRKVQAVFNLTYLHLKNYKTYNKINEILNLLRNSNIFNFILSFRCLIKTIMMNNNKIFYN